MSIQGRSSTGGQEGAVERVLREPLGRLMGIGQGRWLLAAAALGLICYGLYFILQVWYRRL